MAHILVLEDDLALSAGLCFELDACGHLTVAAYHCEKARQLLEKEAFDLALFDVNLPDGSGFDLCREVKEKYPNLPVLFLTANDLEEDVLKGFDLGADDYITKPFRIRELTSRIRSVLRRAGQGGSTLMEFGPVQINAALGKVYKNGQDVFLSALEYRLLMTLANHAGQVLSRNQLLESIWDVSGDFVNDNTLTVYIKRLREKIEDDPQNPVIIETVRGLGYRVGGRR